MNNFRIPKGAIKGQDELKKIEESCRIVAETLSLVEKHVVPGVETIELDRIAEDYIRSKGGIPAFKGYGDRKNPFPNSLCISVNEVVIHGIPSNRKLIEGDVVSVDCGVLKNEYFGDSAVTFAVGSLSDEDERLLDTTHKALEIGIGNAVENNKVYDISGSIQRFVESQGYSLTREFTGHGLGRSLHEFPSVPNFVPSLLQRKSMPNAKLMNGMVLAIEPMVHIGDKSIEVLGDGWTVVTKDRKKAAHFEHTVVIDNGKAVILTLRN